MTSNQSMRRREFLSKGMRAGVGAAALPLAGCATRGRDGTGKSDRAWDALVADLNETVPETMGEAKVPGVSMVLVRDAKIFWRGAFGVKDSESREAVGHGTIFQAASMSKPVFAYAALKLCEQGVIGLDTPLTRYAPERIVPDDPRLDLITARHVLSHTSGLQNWRSTKSPLRIHFTPGSEYRYSGEGYFYLQSIITHLTGKVDPEDCGDFEADLRVCATDFEACMNRRLLAPFAMTSSGYTWSDGIRAHMARGHDKEGAPFEMNAPKAPGVARYGSAGALLSTPTDYAKFLIEVLEPRRADAYRLKEALREEMLRPHVKVTDTTSWALGWALYGAEQKFFGHGGDNKGFHCFAVASLDQKSGYVIMTNGDGGVDLLQRTMPKVNTFLDGA